MPYPIQPHRFPLSSDILFYIQIVLLASYRLDERRLEYARKVKNRERSI